MAVDGATADTALFLMLGALRQFGKAQHNLRDGAFNTGLPLSHDPEGKVVRARADFFGFTCARCSY